MQKIFCKRCNEKVYVIVIEQPPHIRADCSKCLRWITWLSKHEASRFTNQEPFERPTLESIIAKQHGK